MDISDPIRSDTRELVLTNKYNLRSDNEAPNCAKSNVSQDESISCPDKISQMEMESRMAITSFRNNHPKEREAIALSGQTDLNKSHNND